jgi:hypothetical protein
MVFPISRFVEFLADTGQEWAFHVNEEVIVRAIIPRGITRSSDFVAIVKFYLHAVVLTPQMHEIVSWNFTANDRNVRIP